MAQVVTIVSGVTYDLDTIAHVGDLQWSTGWPYGCLEASWSMDLAVNTFPRALTKDARVEIWDGPLRVWAGFISETTPGETWTVNAKGWYAAFANLLALDSTPKPTSIPQTALTQAISRAGLPVTVGTTLSATAFSSADETVGNNYMLPFLDAVATAQGQRWAVDHNYIFAMADDPTTYDYVIDSGEALRGSADDDYVTDIYPRFVATVDGATGEPDSWGMGHVTTVSQPAGRRERGMDITDLGLMTEAAAETLAQGQLDLNGSRMGYTSGIEVGFNELLRPGGTPARLGMVRAGQMVRGFTVADASGAVQLGLTQDVVIGRTQYADGATTVSLTPVGLAPRTFVDTLRALKPTETYDGTAA